MSHVEDQVSRGTVQVIGKRRYRRSANGLCCHCFVKPKRKSGAECYECHAARQRAYRRARREELQRLRAQQVAADLHNHLNSTS
jgi:hypothetical protein